MSADNDGFEYEYLETESAGEEIKRERDSDQFETIALNDIYNIETKTQNDLNLIALVEGNPRLYAKGKAGYKNINAKEMAWISIGKVLKHPLSGSVAKHRWENDENINGDSDSSLLVPVSDIKKRKKTNLEIDSVIKESSQKIAAACSVLPTLFNASSKADVEEDTSLISFLSYGLKRVPTQQKTRCIIKILEVLESFQQD